MQVAPKPVKYVVCQEDTPEKLAEACNRSLTNGFQPHGDLHVHMVCGQTTYTQAMVKVELRPLELPSDIQSGGNILIPRPQIVP
jgi:hypothetical protein